MGDGQWGWDGGVGGVGRGGTSGAGGGVNGARGRCRLPAAFFARLDRYAFDVVAVVLVFLDVTAGGVGAAAYGEATWEVAGGSGGGGEVHLGGGAADGGTDGHGGG